MSHFDDVNSGSYDSDLADDASDRLMADAAADLLSSTAKDIATPGSSNVQPSTDAAKPGQGLPFDAQSLYQSVLNKPNSNAKPDSTEPLKNSIESALQRVLDGVAEAASARQFAEKWQGLQDGTHRPSDADRQKEKALRAGPGQHSEGLGNDDSRIRPATPGTSAPPEIPPAAEDAAHAVGAGALAGAAEAASLPSALEAAARAVGAGAMAGAAGSFAAEAAVRAVAAGAMSGAAEALAPSAADAAIRAVAAGALAGAAEAALRAANGIGNAQINGPLSTLTLEQDANGRASATSDGVTIVQTPDGTTILETPQERTKFNERTLTLSVTRNGVEQTFGPGKLVEENGIGTRTYADGTQVIESPQGERTIRQKWDGAEVRTFQNKPGVVQLGRAVRN